MNRLSSPRDLLSPVIAANEPLKNPCFASVARLVRLVEESLAEIHPAQGVLIVDRNLVQLHIRPRVLNVGLHQRRPLLDRLDQNLLLRDRLLHQRALFRRQRMRLLVLGRFLLPIRAGHTQHQNKQGERNLSKHHSQAPGLLSFVF